MDYYMTRLQNLRTGGDNTREPPVLTGFTFWFGGENQRARHHRNPAPGLPDGSTVPRMRHARSRYRSVLNATPTELGPGMPRRVVASISGGLQAH